MNQQEKVSSDCQSSAYALGMQAMSQCPEVQLWQTQREELEDIRDMEQGVASRFIIPYSLERHHAEFSRQNVIYKSVLADGARVGFVILAFDSDSRSLEFRRIVIAKPGCGYGTKVVEMVDWVCRELGRDRVWLDVFEANHQARHIYERCGYRHFGRSEHEGRALLLYVKMIERRS